MLPPPSLSKDDSVLGMNRTERLRRQHSQMQRPNMPVTPTLPKTSHFQTSSMDNNRNPQLQPPPTQQLQVSQVHNTQQGTSFTIELDSSVPKKTLPPHLAERLSKRTSVPKTVKDSEMGGVEDQTTTTAMNTQSTTTRKSMGATSNSARSSILEFQKRKSLGLRQTSLFNKSSNTSSSVMNTSNTEQGGSQGLTYTTFDTVANHGLTLDDDLEIGFENKNNGSPLLSMPNQQLPQQPPQQPPQQGSFGTMMAPPSQPPQVVSSQQQQEQQMQFNAQPMTQASPSASQITFGFSSQQQHPSSSSMTPFGNFSFTNSQQAVASSQQPSFTFGQQQQTTSTTPQTFANSMNDSMSLGNTQSQQEQERLEQEKLKQQQQQLAMEQQMQQQQQQLQEQQRQQQLFEQQQMWHAQQAQQQQQESSQQPFPQLYPSVTPPNFSPLILPSQLPEESQRLFYEMQIQRAELERERQAHMEMILRERAEIEMTKEMLQRQQMELQAKMQEIERLKQGGLRKNGCASPDDDERKKEVEARRIEKRNIQRTEILKSKRELNLLNVDKLSRASREKQRAEREEEKKRVRSFLPANIFSPPKHKPSHDTLNKRASMYTGTSMRSPPSSRAMTSSESIARSSHSSSNKMTSSGPYLGQIPTNSLQTPQSTTSSLRSFASKTSSVRSMEASPGISKRKQMVLEKTRRKAEEFTRKKLSDRNNNENTPCQR